MRAGLSTMLLAAALIALIAPLAAAQTDEQVSLFDFTKRASVSVFARQAWYDPDADTSLEFDHEFQLGGSLVYNLGNWFDLVGNAAHGIDSKDRVYTLGLVLTPPILGAAPRSNATTVGFHRRE